MHVKIYFGIKPLYLCDALTGEAEEYRHRRDTIFIDELSHNAVDTMLQQLKDPEVHGGIFFHSNLQELRSAFEERLPVIRAGGGFIYTDDRQVLLIYRRGKWDLPKGKLDEGEDMQTCALREVTEETGLTGMQLEELLTLTYHTYPEKGKLVMKESTWFLMKAEAGSSRLTPQTEEDIEKCEWVHLDEIGPYMVNTHKSIADVVRQGMERLKQKAANQSRI